MRGTVFICDRCNQEIKTANKFKIIESDINLILSAELCDNCANKLHDILLEFGFTTQKEAEIEDV